MSARVVLLFFALAAPFLATGAESPSKTWDGIPKPIQGTYQVYSGTPGEGGPPTKKDAKVRLIFTGTLAKDLFDHIGPDLKISCGDAADYRERRRRDLSCTYTKSDGYRCLYGIDVPTGKSVNVGIC